MLGKVLQVGFCGLGYVKILPRLNQPLNPNKSPIDSLIPTLREIRHILTLG